MIEVRTHEGVEDLEALGGVGHLLEGERLPDLRLECGESDDLLGHGRERLVEPHLLGGREPRRGLRHPPSGADQVLEFVRHQGRHVAEQAIRREHAADTPLRVGARAVDEFRLVTRRTALAGGFGRVVSLASRRGQVQRQREASHAARVVQPVHFRREHDDDPPVAVDVAERAEIRRRHRHDGLVQLVREPRPRLLVRASGRGGQVLHQDHALAHRADRAADGSGEVGAAAHPLRTDGEEVLDRVAGRGHLDRRRRVGGPEGGHARLHELAQCPRADPGIAARPRERRPRHVRIEPGGGEFRRRPLARQVRGRPQRHPHRQPPLRRPARVADDQAVLARRICGREVDALDLDRPAQRERLAHAQLHAPRGRVHRQHEAVARLPADEHAHPDLALRQAAVREAGHLDHQFGRGRADHGRRLALDANLVLRRHRAEPAAEEHGPRPRPEEPARDGVELHRPLQPDQRRGPEGERIGVHAARREHVHPVVAGHLPEGEHRLRQTSAVRHDDIVRQHPGGVLRRLLRRVLRLRRRALRPRRRALRVRRPLRLGEREPRQLVLRPRRQPRVVVGRRGRHRPEGDPHAPGREPAHRLRANRERKRQLAPGLGPLPVALDDVQRHRVRRHREHEKAERRHVRGAGNVHLDLRLAGRRSGAVHRFREAVLPRHRDPGGEFALAAHDEEAHGGPLDGVAERVLDPDGDRRIRALAGRDRVHRQRHRQQRRRRRPDLRAPVPARPQEERKRRRRRPEASPRPHRGSTFQKAMPPACLPTSTLAARAPATRSITSTVPGSPPTPSTLTKA